MNVRDLLNFLDTEYMFLHGDAEVVVDDCNAASCTGTDLIVSAEFVPGKKPYILLHREKRAERGA